MTNHRPDGEPRCTCKPLDVLCPTCMDKAVNDTLNAVRSALPPASAGLVERDLRQIADYLDSALQGSDGLTDDIRKAADALEARERELAEAQEAVQFYNRKTADLIVLRKDDVARAEQAEADLTACQRELQSEKDAHWQDVEQLRAALETLRTDK